MLTGLGILPVGVALDGQLVRGLRRGSLAAFNAYTLVHLTHLQFLHAEFFALMLFALDRLIVARRLGDVATLAAGFALQRVHVDLPDGLFGLAGCCLRAWRAAGNC